MAETQIATPKAKPKSVAASASILEMPMFEMPKFEMPKFDMPNVEVPAAFREIAEKETARVNSNATFDLFGEVLSAKSVSEVVELYTAFVRKQFETVSTQAKELADHAQKVATETVEPIKQSFTTAFSKAA